MNTQSLTFTQKIRKDSLMLFLAIPVGITANFITESIREKAPAIYVAQNHSMKGNQTVQDVEIKNVGDYDLWGLSATIDLEKPTNISISPTEYTNFLNIKDSQFNLSIPETKVFKQNDIIELRFITKGFNSIKESESLPQKITSYIKIKELVEGQSSTNKPFDFSSLIIAINVILLIIGFCFGLYIWYKKIFPKDPSTPKTKVSEGDDNE